MICHPKNANSEPRDFMVIAGGQQFTFDSFEQAIDILNRTGILSEDGTAKDAFERSGVLSCAESVETWP